MSPLDYIIRPDQEPKDSVDFEKRLDKLVAELKDLGSDYMTGMYLDVLSEMTILIKKQLETISI